MKGNTVLVDLRVHSVPYSDNIDFLETAIKNQSQDFFVTVQRIFTCYVHHLLLAVREVTLKWARFLLISLGACES